MTSVRPGARFGRWVVCGIRPLGAGGNGEVWRAQSDDGRSGAVKILMARGGQRGRYRLGRFRDEISFLIAHPGTAGILPILDSHVSDDPGRPSWYVMPVAVPIREALGTDPDPSAVVAAIAEIAGTLAALAAEGISHRDIKPDNLFCLDGHWVVGDFGLVAYPDKDPRTEHGRKLGPVDYMAPEMREDADKALAGAADVWALAKTLWVLLTGQSLPLPGTHQPADSGHALGQRITFRYSAALDLLLEKATKTDPEARVSMEDMASELRACTAAPPEASPDADLGSLHTRIAALTSAARRSVETARARRESSSATWAQLAQIVTSAGRELADLLTFDLRLDESGHRASALLGRPSFSPHIGYDTACLLLPPGQQWPAVEVDVAAALRVMRAEDPASIAVALQVRRLFDHGSRHEVNDIWTATYNDLPLGSAQLANVIAEIRARLTGAYPDAMRAVIQSLDGLDAGTA